MDAAGLSRALHAAALAAYAGGFVAALLAARRARWRVPAAALAAGGLAVQLALFLIRWRASGHTPVTGLFESQHVLAIFVVAHALSLLARHRAWGLFAAALGLALAALAGASFGPAAIKPLTPSLDTPLFFLHVAASFAAYGLFGSAALVALLRLLPGGAVPSARAILDESLYLGWILFTYLGLGLLLKTNHPLL